MSFDSRQALHQLMTYLQTGTPFVKDTNPAIAAPNRVKPNQARPVQHNRKRGLRGEGRGPHPKTPSRSRVSEGGGPWCRVGFLHHFIKTYFILVLPITLLLHSGESEINHTYHILLSPWIHYLTIASLLLTLHFYTIPTPRRWWRGNLLWYLDGEGKSQIIYSNNINIDLPPPPPPPYLHNELSVTAPRLKSYSLVNIRITCSIATRPMIN